MPSQNRIHGNWLQAYLHYTRHSEAPEAFHFWTGVSVIAGALRRRVWIDQRFFQWTPNFYIVFVGPPGVVTKTTTVNVGMRLLKKVPGVYFGPQAITWQALTLDLSEHCEMVETGEHDALGQPVRQPMSCVTCSIDELGTFLKPQDGDMIDALTSLWDARLDVWGKKTKHSGSEVIENPWINIIGCTTPSWITKNFTEEMIGGGLASRTIFIYESQKRHLVPYPASLIDLAAFEDEGDKLVHDLEQMASLYGEYILTKEAEAWGADWYKKHWSSRPNHMASDRYSGYIARKQTHIHKLAMIFAAAESNDLRIEEKHLSAADSLITKSERSMNIVFASVGRSDISRHLDAILNFLHVYGEMPVGRMWKNCMAVMSRQEFKAAMLGGVEAGVVRSFTSPQGPMISLPKPKKGP